MTIWTIGHSSLPLESFLDVLSQYRIEAIVDVRRFPASRKHPHFNREQLSGSLPIVGIEYASFIELGGRRRPRPDSRNTAWRNTSFQGYADFMETSEFRSGIERLLELGRGKRTAVMCAETLWWRCHRALIADYLKVLGVSVTHILDLEKITVHPFTSAARIIEGRLSYESAPEKYMRGVNIRLILSVNGVVKCVQCR
jgi:uncharacterized protein (DUF488 family)